MVIVIRRNGPFARMLAWRLSPQAAISVLGTST
jgi:hypothetical protein